MRASLALLAAALTCVSAWSASESNQTPSASSTVLPPPGPGIEPPKKSQYPTGTGGGHPSTPIPHPPVITTTIYGPGTATTTQTLVGTTTITSTITTFLPRSTPVATVGSYTYYSTSLTVSYALTTFTAKTTSYVVVCPTPTPGSGSHSGSNSDSNSGSHPIAGSPKDPSCPTLPHAACPPAVTVTQTIYLPGPSLPAGHDPGSTNVNGKGKGNEKGNERGNEKGNGKGFRERTRG